MIRKWFTLLTVFIFVIVSVFVVGCAGSAQKHIPHLGFGSLNLEADITRADIVVLDRVEGSSSNTSILFGLIQIIDNDKLQLFGIKFFKDKYTYFKDSVWANPVDRAYYKALEAQPEADAVFVMSMDNEDSGVPIICETKTVTFRGKAIKLKADK
jgi:hypothetical protein